MREMWGKLLDIFLKLADVFFKIAPKIGQSKKSNDGFYYENYEKELEIYRDGTVIIKHSFKIIITDSTKCYRIYRYIDVSDDTNIFVFGSLADLMKIDISKRFSEAGFWYNSDNNFLTAVEFPWDENNRARQKSQIIPQELRWYFQLDTAELENGKGYNFKYAASIPNMLPMTDGKYDKTKENSPDYSFISLLALDNIVKRYTYILSFEKGIEMTQPPLCSSYTKGGENQKLLKAIIEDDLFYKKHIITGKNLKSNNIVEYTWDIR